MNNWRNPLEHSITVRALRCALAPAACLWGAAAGGQEMHHHHGVATADNPPVFVASTAKSFAALMDDAMAVMDDGIKRAPMNYVPEHDLVTMLIPHHQGAVDMAKGLLLYSQDPELRNLAQGIIAEQKMKSGSCKRGCSGTRQPRPNLIPLGSRRKNKSCKFVKSYAP